MQESTFLVTNWEEAKVSCTPGSHLITFNSRVLEASSLLTAVLPYVASLSPRSLWVGCQQSPTALFPLRGWSWVDGSDASNLNCGNGVGACGMWLRSPSTLPVVDYPCNSLECHARDFCTLRDSGIQMSGFHELGYALCEIDLVSGAYSLHPL